MPRGIKALKKQDVPKPLGKIEVNTRSTRSTKQHKAFDEDADFTVPEEEPISSSSSLSIVSEQEKPEEELPDEIINNNDISLQTLHDGISTLFNHKRKSKRDKRKLDTADDDKAEEKDEYLDISILNAVTATTDNKNNDNPSEDDPVSSSSKDSKSHIISQSMMMQQHLNKKRIGNFEVSIIADKTLADFKPHPKIKRLLEEQFHALPRVSYSSYTRQRQAKPARNFAKPRK